MDVLNLTFLSDIPVDKCNRQLDRNTRISRGKKKVMIGDRNLAYKYIHRNSWFLKCG